MGDHPEHRPLACRGLFRGYQLSSASNHTLALKRTVLFGPVETTAPVSLVSNSAGFRYRLGPPEILLHRAQLWESALPRLYYTPSSTKKPLPLPPQLLDLFQVRHRLGGSLSGSGMVLSQRGRTFPLLTTSVGPWSSTTIGG